jgi:predicted HicB family RNase H-like nuclease
MKKSKTKIFNIRLPIELHKYLQQYANNNYTSMSKYLIGLILQDRKKLETKNDNLQNN